MLSKKIKKVIKSVAVNDKITNNSKKSKIKQYSLTKIKLRLYEVSKHKGVIKVVNNTKNKEIPSIPKETLNWYKYDSFVLLK